MSVNLEFAQETSYLFLVAKEKVVKVEEKKHFYTCLKSVFRVFDMSQSQIGRTDGKRKSSDINYE